MHITKLGPVGRTRRHHALEHATIRILNRRFPTLKLAGWSTPGGFYLYGAAQTDSVKEAVAEAIRRLKRGERHLAIHPRCGTNLVTAGALGGLVAFLTMLPGDSRSRRERLPLVLLLTTLAMLIAQPLGTAVQQRVTTDPDLAPWDTATVEKRTIGGTPIHRIRLDRNTAA